MTDKKISRSSVARMAGNIASGFVSVIPYSHLATLDARFKNAVASQSVDIALRILNEISKRVPEEGT